MDSSSARAITVSVGDAVLDAAPDGVITIDGAGAILELNTAAERIFDLTRPQALGRRVGDLLVPEPQRPAHEAGLRRVVAGGEPRIMGRRVRLSAQRSDGEEIMVELFVTRTSEAPPRFTAWIRQLSQLEADRAAADEKRTVLEAGEELAAVGSWEWTPSQSKLVWSDNVYRILGLEPGAVSPDPAVIVRLTHPDDRERVRREQQAMRTSGELSPVTYRIVRPDGDVRHLRTALAVAEVRDDEPYRFVGYVQDLTDRLRARRAIVAHLAVSEAITSWTSFEHGARELLAGLADALDCEGAIVWLPVKAYLVARMKWRDGNSDATILDPVRGGSRLPRGELGWTAMARREVARSPSAIAIPAVSRDEVLAVIELRSREPLHLPESLLRSLTGIGFELGQFLDTRRHELDMPPLTPRELEVLAFAARGMTAREIAEAFVVSTGTIKTHFENAYSKLGVSDRAAAVAVVLRLGLVE
ncbi:MAG: hypothetical protein QOI45_3072 [Thermoleophilaceae bacterium]|jgi:PAS domain S-box-containing protein|nr:hypothetical protein [Thermoleophilaceae bacterium]